MTLSPNEPAVQGRASQIAWYQGYPPFELAEKIVELDGRGDLAYARLTYSLKVKMPGAEEPVVDTGKGMEIWKKQKDGSWKVYCDVFNSDLPMATPSEPGAVEQQNEALVRAVFEGLNKRNEAIYQELYAPEYRWYFPSANPKGLTREEEAGFVKLLRAGFPDCHWDVEEMVVLGDRVIARFLFKGTHTGEFQGILPTGNKTEAGGIWMGRVKDGKFVECREENDFLGWMQQMGMELKPKEPKKSGSRTSCRETRRTIMKKSLRWVLLFTTAIILLAGISFGQTTTKGEPNRRSCSDHKARGRGYYGTISRVL